MRFALFPAAAALLLIGCDRDDATAGDDAPTGGTLVIATAADAGTLLPPLIADVQGKQVSDQVFDGLAAIGTSINTVGDEGFTPRLAERWEWAGDSLSIVFHIDPDARWHDGAPVRASDVRFSHQVYTDPRVASPPKSLCHRPWLSTATLMRPAWFSPAANVRPIVTSRPRKSNTPAVTIAVVSSCGSPIPVTVRDPSTPPAAPQQVAGPSPYWGTEAIWTSRANVHNPMFDETGRVWITSRVRPPDNPDFCKAGSSHPSARLFPLNGSGRHLAVYDPKTKEMKHVSTCFGTHHLMFAEDANRTLWTSGGGPVVGWLNTKLWDETGDEEKAQGWTALILDFNGNGRRDEYVEPNAPVDPGKDRRLQPGQYGGGPYALAPAPDGSVWGTMFGFPGAVFRLTPGSNPPETALAEVFALPWNNPAVPNAGFSPRGGDVDRNGVYWAALASGHLASFDRRKCKGALNGPTATGQHCPEGWTFYAEPLPQLGNVTSAGSGEGSYYTWVDQFNTLGLGENVPINTGNQSEGLLVLKDGNWVVMRVPYPMGFYTKWLDGRIDDPDAGWKGRGLWATISTRAPFHMEGGKGTTSKVTKFQMRPDPLAR